MHREHGERACVVRSDCIPVPSVLYARVHALVLHMHDPSQDHNNRQQIPIFWIFFSLFFFCHKSESLLPYTFRRHIEVSSDDGVDKYRIFLVLLELSSLPAQIQNTTSTM